MTYKSRYSFSVLLMIASVFFSSLCWAGKNNSHSSNNNFATVNIVGNTVYWVIDPSVHYESITLSLSSKEFSTTTTNIEEPAIDYLEDGRYRYELVVNPSLGPSIKDELKAIRKAAGGQDAKVEVRRLKNQGKIPKHRQVQSGYFVIGNGELMSADEVEKPKKVKK